MKRYKSNYWKSVLFYASILTPIIMIIVTIPILRDFKNRWTVLLLYPIFFLVEYIFIKYRIIEIVIDDNGILVKNGDKVSKADWADIVDLKEFLFGYGQLLYEIKTKNGEKIGFNDSIENCDDLLREIEYRTGLKFKTRL